MRNFLNPRPTLGDRGAGLLARVLFVVRVLLLLRGDVALLLLLRGDVALLRLLLLGDVLRAAFAPARSMLTSFGKKPRANLILK